MLSKGFQQQILYSSKFWTAQKFGILKIYESRIQYPNIFSEQICWSTHTLLLKNWWLNIFLNDLTCETFIVKFFFAKIKLFNVNINFFKIKRLRLIQWFEMCISNTVLNFYIRGVFSQRSERTILPHSTVGSIRWRT